jgi:hypothetical protein
MTKQVAKKTRRTIVLLWDDDYEYPSIACAYLAPDGRDVEADMKFLDEQNARDSLADLRKTFGCETVLAVEIAYLKSIGYEEVDFVER